MEVAVYKPRNPRASPLFRLLESLYDTVKGVSGGSLRGPLRLLARSLWMTSWHGSSIAATGTQASIRRILDHLKKKERSQRAAGKARTRHGAGVGAAASCSASAFASRRGGTLCAAAGAGPPVTR